MRLFFDENMGRGVPEALRLVGFQDLNYAVNMFAREHAAQGVADEVWIPRIGADWLVVSKDQQLLKRPDQMRLLVEHRVGLICITSSTARSSDLLELLLRRMPRLEKIDRDVQRPFAFRVSLRGPFIPINLPLSS